MKVCAIAGWSGGERIGFSRVFGRFGGCWLSNAERCRGFSDSDQLRDDLLEDHPQLGGGGTAIRENIFADLGFAGAFASGRSQCSWK